MAHGNQLPEGFVLDQPAAPQGIAPPAGFVLDEPASQQPQEQDSFASDARAVLGEFAGSVNKTVAETLDFFGPNFANELLKFTSIESRVPTFSEGFESAGLTGRGTMDPGTARDVVQGAGGIPIVAAGLTAVPRAAGTLGSAALDLLGVGATKAVAPIAQAAQAVTEAVVPGRAAAAKAAKLPLLRESGDAAAAGFKLDPKGKVIPDRVQREAVKQGFQAGLVAQVKTAPKEAKKRFREMVDIVEKGKKNFRFAATNRPLDVTGQSLTNRIKVVKSANQAAGKRLDSVAKSLRGKAVDTSQAVDNFTGNLESMSVRFDPASGKVSFRGSDLEDQAGPQAVMKSVIKRMLRADPNNAEEIHKIKRFIDSIVTFGKQERGLGGNGERVLKQLRADLDNALDTQFPAYDRVNSQYSETIGALDAIQEVAGKKMDFFGPNADKALGTLSRRLLSNAASRVPLMDSIEVLDQLAKKYVTSGGTDVVPFREVAKRSGVKASDLDDDIIGQVMFVDELEKLFGASARTSLQGDVAKGVQAASRGAESAAVEAGATLLERARGINDENAFKAIRELLAD